MYVLELGTVEQGLICHIDRYDRPVPREGERLAFEATDGIRVYGTVVDVFHELDAGWIEVTIEETIEEDGEGDP